MTPKRLRCKPRRSALEQVADSSRSSKLRGRIAQIIRLTKFTTRNLGRHGMKQPHRFDQPRILDRVRRVFAIFSQEKHRQKPTHKGPAPEVKPNPLQREP